jgi:hypothetical protein
VELEKVVGAVFGELREARDADAREGSGGRGSDAGQLVRLGHDSDSYVSSAHMVRPRVRAKLIAAESDAGVSGGVRDGGACRREHDYPHDDDHAQVPRGATPPGRRATGDLGIARGARADLAEFAVASRCQRAR